MKLIITLLFFGIIAAICLWQTYRLTRRGIRGFIDANASRNWASTSGTITIVNAVMEAEKFKRRETANGRRSQYQTYFRPWVQSSYTVDGKSYACDHYAFNDHLNLYATRNQALKRVEKYQVGQAVQVYYDPVNPGWSILEQGNPGPSWKSVFGGVIYFIIALLNLWMMYAAITS
ncbi:MAG: DUF3592 domain-containing protein [Anaerolineales bacterium]|nr:DUF3592 domain-containing protein [Anaerolineales bacterium]MCB9143833.1 DUF3592 domain-containing protein [Anaerolineales bacterium]